MALDYTLNWTDGALKTPFTLTGKGVDATSTSLALTGKGSVNWGEKLQENLLHIMENFASNGNSPVAPTIGQTWFNASTVRLNLKTSTGWKELAYRRIDSPGAPVAPNHPGDIWYDTANNVLKVYTNGGSWALVGSGVSGGSSGGSVNATAISDAIQLYDDALQLQLPTLTVEFAHNLIGGARGSIPYQSAIDTTEMLSPGSDTMILTMAGGLPIWAPSGAGAQTGSGATDGAGQIAYFYAIAAPAGYLKADGSEISRTTYEELWLAMGSPNTGDGSTTFNLPDLRGEFIRGLDDGRGVDASRVLGSAQTDAFQGHKHRLVGQATGSSGGGVTWFGQGSGNTYDGSSIVTDSVNGTPRVTSETRPRNVALLACIRYTAAGQVAGPPGPRGAASTVAGPTGPQGVPGPAISAYAIGSYIMVDAYTQPPGVGPGWSGTPGDINNGFYTYVNPVVQFSFGPDDDDGTRVATGTWRVISSIMGNYGNLTSSPQLCVRIS